MDYLFSQGLDSDATPPRRARSNIGFYMKGGQVEQRPALGADRLRGRALTTRRHVHRRQHGRAGGYTLADMGHVINQGRVPRRRRDLGADAVGRPHGARRRQRAQDHHGRHAPVAARPVDDRHAQRDPPGRPGRLRRRAPDAALVDVRRARLRRRRVGHERRRHGSARRLHDAGEQRRDGDRQGDRLGHRRGASAARTSTSTPTRRRATTRRPPMRPATTRSRTSSRRPSRTCSSRRRPTATSTRRTSRSAAAR